MFCFVLRFDRKVRVNCIQTHPYRPSRCSRSRAHIHNWRFQSLLLSFTFAIRKAAMHLIVALCAVDEQRKYYLPREVFVHEQLYAKSKTMIEIVIFYFKWYFSYVIMLNLNYKLVRFLNPRVIINYDNTCMYTSSGVFRISWGGGANIRWPLVLTHGGGGQTTFSYFFQWWNKFFCLRGPWPNGHS